MNDYQPRTLLTVEQAAEALGVSRTTMFALLKAGDLESITIGRLRRIPADHLDTYIANLTDGVKRDRPQKTATAPEQRTSDMPSATEPQNALPVAPEEPKPRKRTQKRRKHVEGTRAPNGAGSVYLGKDGLWHVRVTVGIKDDGTPDRPHRTAKTEAEAYEKLNDLIAQAKAGTAPKAGRVGTVAEWLTHWVENIAPLSVRETTMSAYRAAVHKHLIPGIGAHKLNRIEPEHFEKLYAKILTTGVSAHTPNMVHRTARTAFNEAVRRGMLQRNVVTLARPPRIEDDEVEPFDVEDAQRIIGVALKRRNGVRYVLALALGIRQGEALGIKWERLDDKTHQLRFPKQIQRYPWKHGCSDPHACGSAWHKTARCPKPCGQHKRPENCLPCSDDCKGHARHCPQRHGGGVVEVDVKSRAGRRRITLPDWLWELIQAHRTVQDIEREHAGTSWQEGGWMFTQEDGRPLHSKADRAEWHEILAEAGVRSARLHDARHTAGTFLGDLGVAPRAAMEMMGWSSAEMMLRYVHANDAMRKNTAKQLGDHLRPETSESPDEDANKADSEGN